MPKPAFEKPFSFGTLRCSGIWPPSKPAGTVERALVPLVPRPALLPLDASPRPTLVLNDVEDGLFTIDEMRRADRMLGDVFAKAGASDRYKCVFYPGPHKFDRPMQAEPARNHFLVVFEPDRALHEGDLDGLSLDVCPFIRHGDQHSLNGEEAMVDPTGSAPSVRAFLGYAGWSAGQLEAEMKQKAWIVQKPSRSALKFERLSRLWFDIMNRLGPWYRMLAAAPDDPSLN